MAKSLDETVEEKMKEESLFLTLASLLWAIDPQQVFFEFQTAFYRSINAAGLTGKGIVEGADDDAFVLRCAPVQRDEMFAVQGKNGAVLLDSKSQNFIVLDGLLGFSSFGNC